MPQFRCQVKNVTVKEKVVRSVDPETKQAFYETVREGTLAVRFDADDLGSHEYKELVSMIGDHAPTLSISMRGGL